jgi:tetrapyrrole methylase family protein/MazG family protein
MTIYILGLGHGSYKALSIGALELLKASLPVFFRTEVHPAVKQLREQGVIYQSFDHIYEQSANFEQVYKMIAEEILSAAQNGDVVYAVPGHPLVAEQSVVNILAEAKKAGVRVEILPAQSFLDAIFIVLKIDPIQGLKVLDGMEMDKQGVDPRVPLIITQVYNSLVAADVKLTLMNHYPDDHQIAVVRAAGVPGEEKVMWIPLYELDRLAWIDHLTSVYVPKGEAKNNTYDLTPLVEVMETLRSPGGCPWDLEQTHASLKRYMVEEVYEVLEAIDLQDTDKLCDELGDLLLQIVFHARISEERGDFTVQDIIEMVTEKMLRRHPHVFGNTLADTADAVLVNWEKIKKEERAGQERNSLLDGVPTGLPSLMRAYKLQGKAAKIGFDWDNIEGVWQKVKEETEEFKEAYTQNNSDDIEQEMGDLLFAIVNLSRFAGVEPETALHRTNKKFIRRFQMMEKIAQERGAELKNLTLCELDGLWDQVKGQETV